MMFTDSNGSHACFAKDPAVVNFKGAYYLYFSYWIKQENKTKETLMVGIATSADMDNWETIGYVPLTQECEENGIGAPAAYVEDGRVHLFYQTYGNRENDCLCHAVSEDGVNFVKDESNPIFKPTDDWCCGRAIDADVVAFGDKLFLYFATRDHEFRVQKVGTAWAKLGSDYSRKEWTQAMTSSSVMPEFKWEGECIEAPATLVRDGKVYMFYGGSYNCTPQQVGYAVSTDGVHFEKPENKPFIPCGAPGDWNASESGHPYAFVDNDGRTYLFYQGSPDGGKTWYISRCELDFEDGLPKVVRFYND